jgi:hypothetical protein
MTLSGLFIMQRYAKDLTQNSFDNFLDAPQQNFYRQVGDDNTTVLCSNKIERERRGESERE